MICHHLVDGEARGLGLGLLVGERLVSSRYTPSKGHLGSFLPPAAVAVTALQARWRLSHGINLQRSSGLLWVPNAAP